MNSSDKSATVDVGEKLLDIIAKEGLVDRAKLLPDTPLDTLGIASADVVVILLAIEEEFGIYIPVDSQLAEVRTVGDLTKALNEQISRQRK